MSRVLFASWPLNGHLHPLMEMARELKTRGWSVAFYCAGGTRRAMLLEGFELYPYVHLDERALEELLHSRRRRGRYRNFIGFLGILRQWLLDTVPGQVRDMEAIQRRWQPSLIVSDESMWGATLVLRDLCTIPVVPVSVLAGCPVPGPEAPLAGMGVPPPRGALARCFHQAVARLTAVSALGLRRRLNRLRRQRGLPPLRGSLRRAVAQAPLYLVRGAPEFDYHRQDLPPSAAYVGPLAWHGRSLEASAPSLNELEPGKPLVFVTEGTMQTQPPFLLRAAARALASSDVQVVMATGSNREPASLDLGPLSRNIHVVRWVQQDELFQRTDLVVTVGGCGTIFGALSAGVPLVVVPEEFDQPDNACRVTETGTGVTLARSRCTAENLRNAVQRVLGEPAFRRNAGRMARAFAPYNGASRAADLLEELAAGVPEVKDATQKRLDSQAVLP